MGDSENHNHRKDILLSNILKNKDPQKGIYTS